MTILEKYGWTKVQHDYYISNQTKDLLPGRITSVKGFKYYLVTENGELEAELSGKLLYGSEAEDLPKTGDWVFYMDYGSIGYIIEMFPRTNALTRKTPGNPTARQVLAANVDTALIVQGLDRDFNLMRLERYRVQVTSCGIVPVVVLNKSDLVQNAAELQKQVNEMLQCTVHVCSTLNGDGIEVLRDKILEQNKTYLLVGSSGAGKSSLLNAVSGNEWQKTGEVSGSNAKGKHTTTTRDLFKLPNGSIVIDTPGMREFGLTQEENTSAEELFPQVSQLAQHCRFPDCGHRHEPGCAVIAALESGELDAMVYESYLKLLKEQHRFGIKLEDKKRIEKQFGKMTREAKDHRKKYKF